MRKRTKILLVLGTLILSTLLPFKSRANWGASIYPALYFGTSGLNIYVSYSSGTYPSTYLYGYPYWGLGWGLPFRSHATYKPIEQPNTELKLKLMQLGEMQKEEWIKTNEQKETMATLPPQSPPELKAPEIKTAPKETF